MVGNASVAVLWSVYYARQKFLWAELSPVFANVLSLLFLFGTLPQYGIAAASVGHGLESRLEGCVPDAAPGTLASASMGLLCNTRSLAAAQAISARTDLFKV